MILREHKCAPLANNFPGQERRGVLRVYAMDLISLNIHSFFLSLVILQEKTKEHIGTKAVQQV